eukprot:TRINITY_DN759_c0_g1_i4.p1 TRINITY_DN759_c0_g1~~TRINITY_DN759_c0_g1_i4.p1  ORF type:complete len:313 (-),score=60.69 TRINITY_DN759_c0_g1_i4:74-1012(-)
MKRILVTGANKGIGLAIVSKLLQDYPDTYLLLGSRDIVRGEAALQQVVKQLGYAGKNRVDLIQIDVTSEESVNKAVETVRTKFGDSEPLYGLVNNAGGATGSSREILELNTYSLRRVTEAFLPLIQKNKGRIVQISSGAAPMFVKKCNQDIQSFLVNKNVSWPEIEKTIIAPFLKISEDPSLDDEQKSEALTDIGLSGGGMGAYGISKTCVNAYTIELAKKFPTILSNSCSPGFIETDLSRPMAQRSGKKPEEMGMLPVEKGTVSANYLMMGDLEGDIEGYESGRYYGSDGKWSPFHKTRSPGDPVYDGTFP